MRTFLSAIALVSLLCTPPAVAQEADPAKGAEVFKKCRSCHMVGDKARNLVGPTLNGIVDGKIAAVEGYKYSKAMKQYATENSVWSEALLDTYLEKPAKAVKGTRMAFVGLRKPKDRADVIAYLKQFSAQ
ncbi:MAG: c-type cytochrome [Parvibaculales bacterium]